MQVDSHAGMKTVVKPDPGLTAPIAQGQQVGTVTVTAPDFPALTVPVYAAQAVDRASIFSRPVGNMFGTDEVIQTMTGPLHHPGRRRGHRQIHPGQAPGRRAGSKRALPC